MTFIGIDPAAETFTAACYENGTPKTFDNSLEGIEAFLAWLEEEGLTPETTHLCLENTGVYSERLCYGLHDKHWPLSLIEPVKVWRAFNESRPKTDALDSLKIAEYGYRYSDKLSLWQPNEAIVEQIKVLLATREQLVEQKTALSNTRKALARKVVQTPAANTTLETTAGYLKQQIKALEAEIQRLINEHPSMAQMVAMITTAPGIGLLAAAVGLNTGLQRGSELPASVELPWPSAARPSKRHERLLQGAHAGLRSVDAAQVVAPGRAECVHAQAALPPVLSAQTGRGQIEEARLEQCLEQAASDAMQYDKEQASLHRGLSLDQAKFTSLIDLTLS